MEDRRDYSESRPFSKYQVACLKLFFRKRKFETDLYKQERFREMEEQRLSNQKKIMLMRNQIMSNISNQRDNVHMLNRKAKEEVAENIRLLKEDQRKQTESERFRQKMK